MKTNTLEEQQREEIQKEPASQILLILSAIVFALVCLISLFFFIRNSTLSTAIEKNNTEIATYTKSIEREKSNSKIVMAELITNNKSEILASIKNNEAQTYMRELQNIASKYKMLFSGFSYTNGKISTSAVAIPEKILVWEDGIKKISDFVGDYRTGTGLLFSLSPVLSVSGYEQKRAFSIEFSVNNMK